MKSSSAQVWMDAASALDELHEDADFRDISAEVDALQMQQHQQWASPIVAVDLNTLYAFLSEMEKLDDDAEGETSAPVQKPDSTTPGRLNQDLLTAQATASVAMEENNHTPEPKKKKLSTLDRTRREKAALRQEIELMEHQIQQIQREHHDRLSQLYAKRWGPVIQHELHRKETLEAEQFELRRLVQHTQHTWEAALALLDKMRAFVQVRSD